ncbi:MAG: CC_3452 family protein [Pseudomonadota bacterium]|jgi:cytochrome c556
MKIATTLAAALLLAMFAAEGSAAPEPVVAKLRTATAKEVKFVAAGTIFRCERRECVAASPNYRTISTQACKQISRRFGAVESMGDSRKSLDADKIATCNGSRS